LLLVTEAQGGRPVEVNVWCFSLVFFTSTLILSVAGWKPLNCVARTA
jgi:hypothetical protein